MDGRLNDSSTAHHGEPDLDRLPRLLLLVCAILALVELAACATLPSVTQRAPSTTLVAAPGTRLASAVASLDLPPDASAVRALPEAEFALDARIALMRATDVSLDVQTYLLADDALGRQMVREMSDAAARGVRVRLLVDDLLTHSVNELLLGLAASPNVEVRVYNPFAMGRTAVVGRLLNLLTDFERLNHRMHNKLLVADGRVALIGGRNLAAEYFERHPTDNFVDLELVLAGAVVPMLSVAFDQYWNSDRAFPLSAVAHDELAPDARRTTLAAMTAADGHASVPLQQRDSLGRIPLSAELNAGHLDWIVAGATAVADSPAKGLDTAEGHAAETVAQRFRLRLSQAHSEALVVTPYFIPIDGDVAQLRGLREQGINVRVITNSIDSTDEPLASLKYGGYRTEILKMGVSLYELGPNLLDRDPHLRNGLGSSRGRLHAKFAIVDRELVMVGSMNFDRRSANLNTEVGVGVRSAALAEELRGYWQLDSPPAFYEVRLEPTDGSIQWLVSNPDGTRDVERAPQGRWLDQLRARLFSLFVSDDLL